MENHHFYWENPLFLWPLSIAMFVYQRVVASCSFDAHPSTTLPRTSEGSDESVHPVITPGFRPSPTGCVQNQQTVMPAPLTWF